MAAITLIIYGELDQVSGGYYYDRELVKQLEKRGHVVSVENPGIEADDRTPAALYIIDELCHPDFHRKRHFRQLKEGVPVCALVHHLKADEHTGFLERHKHLFRERRFFRAVDFAVFNSIATKGSVERSCGYRGASAVAVPGKVPLPRNEAGPVTKKSRSCLSLVFLGNLIPRKNLHRVIDHLKALESVPYRFTIAGNRRIDPEYTETLRARIRRYSLEDRITIIGPLPEERKTQFLADADIFVMPSTHEGYGIVFLEAMQFGTIPLAGISGGASEIIEHGRNGYLVHPDRKDQFCEILEQLWENGDLRNRMARNARESWEDHPTWSDSMTTVIEVLEEQFL